MDTHKKQHQVAWVHPETAEVQEFAVPNTVREIKRMVKKIRKQSPGGDCKQDRSARVHTSAHPAVP